MCCSAWRTVCVVVLDVFASVLLVTGGGAGAVHETASDASLSRLPAPLEFHDVYQYPKLLYSRTLNNAFVRSTPASTLLLQSTRYRVAEHIVRLTFRRGKGPPVYRKDTLVAMDVSYPGLRSWRHVAELTYADLGPLCRQISFFTPALAASPNRRDLIIYDFGPWPECDMIFVWRDMQLRRVHAPKVSAGSARYLQSIVTLRDDEEHANTYRVFSYGGLVCNKYLPTLIDSSELDRCCTISSSLRYMHILSKTRDHIEGTQWQELEEVHSPFRPRPLLFPSLLAVNHTIIVYGGVPEYHMHYTRTNKPPDVDSYCTFWVFNVEKRAWTSRNNNATGICRLPGYGRQLFPVSVIAGKAVANIPRAVLFANESKILLQFSVGHVLRVVEVCSVPQNHNINSPSSTLSCQRIFTHRVKLLPAVTKYYGLPGSFAYHTVGGGADVFYGTAERQWTIRPAALSTCTSLAETESACSEFIEEMIYDAFRPAYRLPGGLDCASSAAILVQTKPVKERAIFLPGSMCINGFDIRRYEVSRISERRRRPMGANVYWILDTTTNEYETRTMAQCTEHAMSVGTGSTATQLNARVVFLLGTGYIDTSSPVENLTIMWCIDILNFTCMEFTNAGTVQPPRRCGHMAVRLDDRHLLVYGGRDEYSSQYLSDLWVLTLDSIDQCKGTWKILKPTNLFGAVMPSLRYPRATHINNTLFVFGDTSACTDYIVALDISRYLDNGTISIHQVAVQPCLRKRRKFASVQYNNNGILLLGGRSLFDIEIADLTLLDTSNIQAQARVVPFFSHGNAIHIYGHHIVRGQRLYVFSGTTTTRQQERYLTIETELCPMGYELHEDKTCRPCVHGFFSSTLHGGCKPCPNFTTTETEGSSSCIAISPCHSQDCHQHGVCIVTDFSASCHCDFGYVSYDNCRLPLVSLAIASAILLFVSFIALAQRKYHTRSQQLKLKERELQDKHKSMRLYQKKLDQINIGARIRWSSLNLTKKLARGAFSQVWQAEFSDMLVAVKVLPKYSGRNTSQTDQFVQEAEVLRSIRHPNIVIFLGAGTNHSSKRPFIVMEYLRRGSLYHVLHDGGNVFTHYDHLRFALDTARGMTYLHESNPPRLHRDLKSPNLLVSDKWVVKIGDLGNSRFMAILDEEKVTAGNSTSANAAQTGLKQSSNTGAGAQSVGESPKENVLIEPPCTGAVLDRRDSKSSTVLSGSQETSLSTPLLTDVSTNHGETYQRYSASVMTRGVGTLRWKSPESVRGEHYNEKADIYRWV